MRHASIRHPPRSSIMRRRSSFLVLTVLVCLLRGGPASAEADRPLDAATLRRALDEFKAALDERWSYRHANQADFDGAMAVLGRKVGAGLSADAFGLELQKIIALGIDGHALVSGYELPRGGHLPFLIEPEGERFVA